MVPAGARVAILFSTFQGERYLAEQLRSFSEQSHPYWTLYWRDDGSTDGSRQLVRAYAERSGRCVASPTKSRQGVTGSFLALLATARCARAGSGVTHYAFADQDDVWLPGKLAAGVAGLSAVPPDIPALYCSGQILVDRDLRRIGRSAALRRQPGFPAALTQNIATGCTVMLNAAAADLVLASAPPMETLHDWWCYLVVSAAGGRVIADPTATVLYRQHAGNLVGAPAGLFGRGLAASRRGPGPFMRNLRAHVGALEARADLLTPAARHDLAVIADALRGGLRQRLAALRLPGFRRQSWPEDAVFRVWFCLG